MIVPALYSHRTDPAGNRDLGQIHGKTLEISERTV